MNIKEVLSKIDHTILSQTATWNDIKNTCDEAINFSTASVCIPQAYVKQANNYVEDKIKICTVIGFPNGYSTTCVKVFEANDSIENGANEIDMVMNVGFFKENKFDLVLEEINRVKEACKNKILKVIIETCLLDKDEKIKACEIVSNSNADFIKTSTGFSSNGATFDDILLMKKHVRDGLGIKAAGGIGSINDAEKFLSLGATRLGTSKIIKILNQN